MLYVIVLKIYETLIFQFNLRWAWKTYSAWKTFVWGQSNCFLVNNCTQSHHSM